jgi:aminopeptidase N
MPQWYPKLAEYDYQGWHPDQYIAREFFGVWGDFDVKITIDSDYVLGGTGYLQNPNEIGYNYQDEGVKVQHDSDKLTWHFKAPNVHDFAWAADKDYIHDKFTAADGTVLHFLYQDDPEIKDNWKKLQPKTEQLLMFYNEHIGQYPYDQYSVIQGGDGGMEYGMSTLITGERKFGSLFGVTAHEMAHSWFQFVLATNENIHEWMDEGFTTYISTLAEEKIMEKNSENPFQRTYQGYNYLANSGAEQPQSTNADRYQLNMAYGLAAYSKGAVFLRQLEYLIGKKNVDKTLKRYFQEWKFKHPTPNDFIRVAEKVSGAQLGWYLREWTKTTNTVDYAIEKVSASAEKNDSTTVQLKRKGLIPMPIELKATFTDGTTKMYYIPLRMMYFQKDFEGKTEKDWAWGFSTYELTIDCSKGEIQKLEIDPSKRMADVKPKDNVYKQ